MGLREQGPVKVIFCRPWKEKRGITLLWICLSYTHQGPAGESFASSTLCRAFQGKKALPPGLVSGQPFFCASAAWKPLAVHEQVQLHLSYCLLEPDKPATLDIQAFAPFSSPHWRCRFSLSPLEGSTKGVPGETGPFVPSL